MRTIKNLLGILLLLTVLLILFLSLKPKIIRESFDVTFGTPPETSSTDSSTMKDLLEIGSQAQENTTYDTVATHYLGDLNTGVEEEVILIPPDPVCFTEETSNSDIPSLSTYSPNCCH